MRTCEWSASSPGGAGLQPAARKVLADIHGRPLLWHVWDRVRRCRSLAAVYIATDSRKFRRPLRPGGSGADEQPDLPLGH